MEIFMGAPGTQLAEIQYGLIHRTSLYYVFYLFVFTSPSFYSFGLTYHFFWQLLLCLASTQPNNYLYCSCCWALDLPGLINRSQRKAKWNMQKMWVKPTTLRNGLIASTTLTTKHTCTKEVLCPYCMNCDVIIYLFSQ